jgi:hypothetical protein
MSPGDIALFVAQNIGHILVNHDVLWSSIVSNQGKRLYSMKVKDIHVAQSARTDVALKLPHVSSRQGHPLAYSGGISSHEGNEPSRSVPKLNRYLLAYRSGLQIAARPI